mgnify:FL=1
MLTSGERLKNCRKDNGLTQKQLAEQIYSNSDSSSTTGSEKQIGFLENNAREMSDKYAKVLSQALSVRYEYLLLYDNYRTVEELRKAEKAAYNGIDTLLEFIASQQKAIISDPSSGCNHAIFKEGKEIGSLSWVQYEKLREDIFAFSMAWLTRILKECEEA